MNEKQGEGEGRRRKEKKKVAHLCLVYHVC